MDLIDDTECDIAGIKYYKLLFNCTGRSKLRPCCSEVSASNEWTFKVIKYVIIWHFFSKNDNNTLQFKIPLLHTSG